MVFGKVKKILEEFVMVDMDAVELDATFEEINADSLDLVEIICECEDCFDIQIPEEVIADTNCKIRTLVEYIQSEI